MHNLLRQIATPSVKPINASACMDILKCFLFWDSATLAPVSVAQSVENGALCVGAVRLNLFGYRPSVHDHTFFQETFQLGAAGS